VKQELLPQYAEEKKEDGIVLGATGDVDLVKQKQLEEVRKKLGAVKQEAYPFQFV
jgi:NAD+--asparagine ADP-ribosyltransferase